MTLIPFIVATSDSFQKLCVFCNSRHYNLNLSGLKSGNKDMTEVICSD